ALMSADNFFIVRYDEARQTARFLYFVDQLDPWQADPDREIPLDALETSLTAALLRDGRTRMGASNLVREELDVPRDTRQGPDSAAWMGAPMRRDGVVSGAVVVQN